MNKITKPVPKTMQLDNPSEELTEESKPKNQPAEQSQTEETLSTEPSQEPHSEQPIEPQFQIPKPPESRPLPSNERINAAYKLVYGENAKMPPKDEAIAQPDDEWFIRSFFGALFATPNDNPLTQKFSNLDELLTWFYQAYPLQQQEDQGE